MTDEWMKETNEKKICQICRSCQTWVQHLIYLIISSKLVVDTELTKCVVLGLKPSLKDIHSLHITTGSTNIKQVTEAKLLLIVTWADNWSNVDRCVKKHGCCEKLQEVHACFIKPLVQVLVLSQLDYRSLIWSNTTETNLNRLQVVQNKVAHIVLLCLYTANVSLMTNLLVWLNVRSRLQFSSVSFNRNIIITKTLEILYSKWDRHHYCTRREGGFLSNPEDSALSTYGKLFEVGKQLNMFS